MTTPPPGSREAQALDKAIEAAADVICRMRLDETAIYGPTEYAQAAIRAYLTALKQDPEVVQTVATLIAHAMFADGSGDESPTVAGYYRAARAVFSALEVE